MLFLPKSAMVPAFETVVKSDRLPLILNNGTVNGKMRSSVGDKGTLSNFVIVSQLTGMPRWVSRLGGVNIVSYTFGLGNVGLRSLYDVLMLKLSKKICAHLGVFETWLSRRAFSH